MTTSSGALFTLGMFSIGSFFPTKVLLGHSSSPSTPIPSSYHNRYELLHKGVTCRLGGVKREMSLLEFGLRVGLYTERESRDVVTLSGLRRAETVNSTHLTHLFWPSIGDDGFNGEHKSKIYQGPKDQACSSVHHNDHYGEVVEEDEGDDEEGGGEEETRELGAPWTSTRT
uniref:Uncharacterized protein n=1 Tax=Tanacetum cinerariifolium TaxID=118510 RepID=A0A699GNR4_TANCI|nr:hypothetical protein [Tanacetum cinerariifolium]